MENFETAPFDRSGTSPRAIRRGRERAIAPEFRAPWMKGLR
jgi:hypothetical protein